MTHRSGETRTALGGGDIPLIEPEDFSIEDRGFTSPCWIWTRGTRAGRPVFARNGQYYGYAKRIMWEQQNGVPPEPGEQLMCQCSNLLCINPSHFRYSRRRLGLPPRDPSPPRRIWEWNLRDHGITPDEYEEMLAAQNGGCAVCGAISADQSGRRLHVDHCHTTGQIRGLLCSNCNNALGRANDDAERLHALADYLDRSRASLQQP